MRKIFILLTLSLSLTFCGGSSNGGIDPNGNISGTGSIVGVVSVADNVTFSQTSNNAFSSSGVRVSVDGSDSLYGDTDTNGNFTIHNIPLGTHCIKASTQDSSNQIYGFRKCYNVAADETNVGTVTMEKAGTLKGIVYLEDTSDFEGTLIYAAGTSYSAYTDAAGSFTISNLPPGEYDVTITHDVGFSTSKFTSVIIAPSATTDLGTLTLVTSESCTDGGAVLAVTSTSQSSDTIDIGESVTFSITACSSLDLGIDYTWYQNYSGGDSVTTGNSFTYASTSSDGGSTKYFFVKAEIDKNNYEYIYFAVHVRNNDYFQRVGTYATQVPASDPHYGGQTSGIGKYGNYIYYQSYVLQTQADFDYYTELEIIDASDPTNLTYVNKLDYNNLTSQRSGLMIEGSKMFVNTCENNGTNIYVYDLASDPTSPTLLTTLTNTNLLYDSVGNACLLGNYYISQAPIWDGRYLYVAIDGYGISIIDLNLPSIPVLLSTITESNRPLSMAHYSNYLIATNNLSLDIWDISNPIAPFLTSTYTGENWGSSSTGGDATVLYSNSGKIYVAHDSYGLEILDVTHAPTIVSVKDLDGVYEASCGGFCSHYAMINNTGNYTLFAKIEGYDGISSIGGNIFISDSNNPDTIYGSIYSYVNYFDPDIYGILSDDSYIYVAHNNDGFDIFEIQ